MTPAPVGAVHPVRQGPPYVDSPSGLDHTRKDSRSTEPCRALQGARWDPSPLVVRRAAHRTRKAGAHQAAVWSTRGCADARTWPTLDHAWSQSWSTFPGPNSSTVHVRWTPYSSPIAECVSSRRSSLGTISRRMYSDERDTGTGTYIPILGLRYRNIPICATLRTTRFRCLTTIFLPSTNFRSSSSARISALCFSYHSAKPSVCASWLWR